MQSSSSCRSWDMTEQSSNVKGIDRYCKLCQRDLAKVKVVKGRAVAKLYKSFVGCGNFATRLPYAAVSIDNGTDATYVHLWTPLKHPGTAFCWYLGPHRGYRGNRMPKVPNSTLKKCRTSGSGKATSQRKASASSATHGEVMLKKTMLTFHLWVIFWVFRNNPNIQTLLSIRIDHSSLAVYLNCGTNYSKGSQSLHTS